MVKHQELIKKTFPNPKQVLTYEKLYKMTVIFDENIQQYNLREK